MINFLKAHQEKFLFIVSGGFQYLMDMCFFVLLVLVFGANININIASRLCAGAVGFYVNGYIVFKTLKGKPYHLQLHSAIKFIILWALMTLISSLLLSFFVGKSGLYFIIAKGIIEILLSILSFFVQKYLVYRHRR